MKKIKLIYAGARITGMVRNEISHCFMHGKKEVFWTRSGYATIGSIVYAEEGPNGLRMDLRQFPEGRIENIPQEWLDKDAAAREMRKQKAAVRKGRQLGRASFKDLDGLRARFKKLDLFERREFVRALERYLNTGK